MSVSQKGKWVGTAITLGLFLVTGGVVIAVMDLSQVDQTIESLDAIGHLLYAARITLMAIIVLYWRAFLQGLYIWKLLTVSEVRWLGQSQAHRAAFFCIPVSVDTLFQFINYL